MRLDDQRESGNIENRRDEGGIGFGGAGQGAGGMGGGGLGGLLGLFLPLIGSKFGIIGIVVAMGAIFLFSNMGGQSNQPAQSPQVSAQAPGTPSVCTHRVGAIAQCSQAGPPTRGQAQRGVAQTQRTRGGADTARQIGAGRRGLGKFLVIWGFAPVHKALLSIKIIAN